MSELIGVIRRSTTPDTIKPPVCRQIVGSGPHLTLATTEPILVQMREEPLLEALFVEPQEVIPEQAECADGRL